MRQSETDVLTQNTSISTIIQQGKEEAMSTQAALKSPISSEPAVETGKKMYTFEVSLVSGPMSEAFVEENPEVSRTIQIKSDQTLEDLHDVIFTAFDREDDNMYEFRLGNGPHDPEGRYYVLPSELSGKSSKRKMIAGDVTKTRISSLELKPSDTFTYWFDFSDDWMHRVTVVSIDDKNPQGRYPRVIARTGESPSQYEEFDGEDTDEEEYAEEEWSMIY